MKSRFEPDVDSGLRLPASARLIDPEAYDASEQRFAASVEEKSAPPRFVLDVAQESSGNLKAGGLLQAGGGEKEPGQEPDKPPTFLGECGMAVTEIGLDTAAPSPALQTELLEPPDSGSWRNEVSARVNDYRARRRPRVPRYPSLQLKFDPPEPSWTAQAATSQPAPSGRLAVAMQDALGAQEEQAAPLRIADAEAKGTAETGARILEFPRSAAPPPVFDELAEPVVDRPRILEVPELVLPPPALGGILMEPVEEPAQERRRGFELPLQTAPMSRRLLAGAIDSLLVIAAFAAFAYIFFRITAVVPSLQQAAGISVCLIALFWIAYQYFLLVYAGTTPGLRLAHLQLSRFDGTAVPKKIRRWRVLASALSGLSLALGYAWCFLDEDRLCWHDRITRTYMAPKPSKPESPSPA
ncbi:MAG TPA: RDD family protein [Terriglobales bacterium]|nr:RDD family protein [Terriglobales bacterium]